MTFSLAGICRKTGMMGAVITTSSPAVGSRCVFAKAGIGVVLTQFWTDPRLGPRGLALLSEGCGAASALDAVVASTPERAWRQLAMLDATGGTAHYTGQRNKPAFAAATGDGCVAIGNILRNDSVPAAMVDAFAANAQASLPNRLLAALDAGHAAGGEEKPLVSAALLVVRTAPFPYVDLRVDAAAAPLTELRNLWTLYEPFADTVVGRALTPDALS
jgi:uncharacterized Ntn-hydrolase superfamily protein